MPNIYPFLKPVNSSMFSRAGFDEDTWRLVFEFKSTKEIRAYLHCSPEVADACLTSDSIGKWFNANIRGNSQWEHEILGAEESVEPAPKPPEPQGEGFLSDDDLDLICGPRGTTEPGVYPSPSSSGDITLDKVQGVLTEPAQPQMHITEVAKWPEPSEIRDELENFDAGTFNAISDDPPSDKSGYFASTLATQLHGDVLGAWTAPESAAEALDLLAERENEIKAILAQNKQTGEQALTIKVDSEETLLSASETLNRLVAKRDLTSQALDPFRKVLYDAYTEAGAKVSAGLEPLKKGIDHIKVQILSWKQAQERIRQQKIREANEAREAEARRLQEAEAERIKLADVTDALESGDEQRAQTLFDAVVEVPKPYVAPVFIPPATPKVEGQSTSTTWKVDRDAIESDKTGQAYVASISALLRAVKSGAYPIEQAAPLLSWDFAAADKLAGALQAAFNVPGLTAVPKETLRVGAGRRKKG